jgi:hypothetical protein
MSICLIVIKRTIKTLRINKELTIIKMFKTTLSKIKWF